jgi:hypothetical protein
MGRELTGTLEVEDVINDPSLAEGLTKECSACYPLTPYHQERENCTVCGGSGEEPLAIAQIAKEIAEAKAQHRKNGTPHHSRRNEGDPMF